MAERVVYRRKVGYNTRSNKIKKVRTPGGKLTVHYPRKKTKFVTCGEPGCGLKLGGLKRLRREQFKRVPKKDRSISRAYGGNICGKCVRNRIIRAFLTEEVKIVKRVMTKK